MYLYVNVVGVNEMCMGHVKRRLGRVSVAIECDCEQNYVFVVDDNVA